MKEQDHSIAYDVASMVEVEESVLNFEQKESFDNTSIL